MITVEKNPMLEKMKRDEPVLGCQVRSRSPLVAEMLGYCGLDYVFIEGEHFVHNIETVENQIRAVQVAGAVPIVRLPSHEDGLILQVIEAGAFGVIFPHIDTKEQALHAIHEVKYAPLGARGFGDSARASCFGFIPTDQYLEYVNRNVMVIGMIESREGIRNLDEILSTGIDVLRIGAKDLSLDMGYGGVVTPEVKETVKSVCRRIRAVHGGKRRFGRPVRRPASPARACPALHPAPHQKRSPYGTSPAHGTGYRSGSPRR